MLSTAPREDAGPTGVVAILRLSSPPPDAVCEALADAGIRFAEITWGTPECLATLSRWQASSTMSMGVGTVRRPAEAAAAACAGARFLVTPTTREEVLTAARAAGLPVACGALTPTEIERAHELGAAVVKVFPADALGGPGYLRSLRAPMPDVPLMPVGGSTVESVAAYGAIGCVAVGIGSALVNDEVVRAGDWSALTRTATAFVRAWDDGRGGHDA